MTLILTDPVMNLRQLPRPQKKEFSWCEMIFSVFELLHSLLREGE